MTRVLHTLGLEFQAKLSECKDLDEVRALHEWYVQTIRDRCLLRDRAASVRDAILEIFAAALDYRVLWDTVCGAISPLTSP
jgi:hypothetical protein